MKKLKDAGEFGWIESLKKKTRTAPSVKKGIGDDAAVISLNGKKVILFTTDMLLENRHFRHRECTAREIGWKAMAVNVSDIAAMGGRPTYAVISAGLPPDLPLKFAQGIYDGLNACARRFGVSIVGGDTNASKNIILSVALLGEAAGKPVLRSGAKPGDSIFVSGTLGGSYASKKHLRFVPRVKESLYLCSHFRPTAMMDLSDGLASDIHRLTKESRVGAVLFAKSIPVSRYAAGLDAALKDGEDFELLFTLSAKNAARLVTTERRGFVPFKKVGRILPAAEGVRLETSDGRLYPLPAAGFDHFRKK